MVKEKIISIKEKIAKYKKNKEIISKTQEDLLSELIVKLDYLELKFFKIKEIITVLTGDMSIFKLNQDTGVVSFNGVDILKLNRANLDKPVVQENISEGYFKDCDDFMYSKEKRNKQKELEMLTEEYYQIAHRIGHIIIKLPGLKSFDFKEISIIRNNLIEHPEGKNSMVMVNSFSYSRLDGPVIKGIRINNQLNHLDKGLYLNNERFLNEIEKVFVL